MTRLWALLALFMVLPATAQKDSPPGEKVQCGLLICSANRNPRCFSDHFLRLLERDSTIHTQLDFVHVDLESDELFQLPFVVLTGEGSFSFTDAERDQLAYYVENGGFVLASASCSDARWDRSFRKEIEEAFPDLTLNRLTMEHPVFHTVFEVDRIEARGVTRHYLEGLEINGRLCLVYSQLGLNETGRVQGCCCCGGNEIRNAGHINANILAYALTH